MDAKEPFEVTGNSKGTAYLYPSIEQKLNLNYSKPSYDIPGGTEVFGTITFVSSASNKTEYELPITINFNKDISNE